MQNYIEVSTTIYDIWKVLFWTSTICALLLGILEIILILTKKKVKWFNMEEQKNSIIFVILGVCVIITLLGMKISENTMNNAISYNTGIEYMSDGQWYDAAIAFNNASNQNNADILRDYCYYVYLLDEHPDWVPWMGLTEITGVCN